MHLCVCWETLLTRDPQIQSEVRFGWEFTRKPGPRQGIQYNTPFLSLSASCLYLSWKLTRVASMTKQNGFCHRCPSLVNVFMACCVSGSHPQAAGSLLLCCRSEAEPIKRPWKMHRWRWIWRRFTSCPLLSWSFEDAPGRKGQKVELNTCFLHLQHEC